MSRITLKSILSAFSSISGLNSNFQKISDAIDKTLFRDGTGDNQLLADINMNHFNIKNVGDAIDDNDAVNYRTLIQKLTGGSGNPGIVTKDITDALGFTPLNSAPRYFVEAYRQIGFTDTQTVQAAINAASILANGKAQVLLSSVAGKVYNIVSTGLILAPNVILDSLHFVGGNSSPALNQDVIITIPEGAHNSGLRNCSFDCTAMKTLRSSSVTGAGSIAITTSNTTTLKNIRFENNKFKMNAQPNPSTSESNGQSCWVLGFVTGVFTGNYSDQCPGDTFNFNGGFVIVTGNIAMNGGDGGIAMNNGAQGIVSNNYIFNCSLGVGIGPNPAAVYMLISDNLIDGCGIGIAPGSYGGPNPHHIKISGNNIRHCGEGGIVYNGSTYGEEISLVITDNFISDSQLWQGSGGGQGIIVNKAGGAIISGNYVTNCTGFGYYFSGSVGLFFDGNYARACGYPILWINTLGDNEAFLGENFFYNNTNLASAFPLPQKILGGKVSYSGTLDGSGNAVFAHNFFDGLNGTKRVETYQGSVLTTGNSLVPAVVSYIDGTNISISTTGIMAGTQPGRPYFFTLTLKPGPNY